MLINLSNVLYIDKWDVKVYVVNGIFVLYFFCPNGQRNVKNIFFLLKIFLYLREHKKVRQILIIANNLASIWFSLNKKNEKLKINLL